MILIMASYDKVDNIIIEPALNLGNVAKLNSASLFNQ